jgi:hypothetical protein
MSGLLRMPLNALPMRLRDVFAAGLAAVAYVFALALLAEGMAAPAALAAGADHDDANRDRSRGAQDDRHWGNARRGNDRGYENDRREREERSRYERQHYWRYQRPVYAPAPVYYPPPASPGITLVLPLEFRAR